MKKILLLLLLLIPMNVFAESFKFEDMVISLDDPDWVIFTKDNLENNPAIEANKISMDVLKDLFNNKSVYLDANIFDSVNPAENIELIVGISDNDSRYNLHNYTKRRVNKILKESVNDYKDYKVLDSYIYSNNKYTYIAIYYEDNFVYITDYITTINGKTYTIKYQKGTEFNESDKKNVESIIDKIEYDRKEEYEVKPPLLEPVERIIVYGVLGGIIGATCSIIMRRRMNR